MASRQNDGRNRPRLTVTIDPELWQAIEDLRFEKRFPSRSQAIEEILKRGLEAMAQRRTQ